jgi:hypothetical protein
MSLLAGALLAGKTAGSAVLRGTTEKQPLIHADEKVRTADASS